MFTPYFIDMVFASLISVVLALTIFYYGRNIYYTVKLIGHSSWSIILGLRIAGIFFPFWGIIMGMVDHDE